MVSAGSASTYSLMVEGSGEGCQLVCCIRAIAKQCQRNLDLFMTIWHGFWKFPKRDLLDMTFAPPHETGGFFLKISIVILQCLGKVTRYGDSSPGILLTDMFPPLRRHMSVSSL
jgi:hypothetical protein